MDTVDNVKAKLAAARSRADTELYRAYKKRLSQPLFRCRHSNNPYSKYNYTRPNRGRYVWAAKTIGFLDYLPLEVSRLAVSKMDGFGEWLMVFRFEAPIHHETLRKLLKKWQLEVIYIKGVTVSYMEEVARFEGTQCYSRAMLD